ncbi:MAG TPA: DHHA1 domain-containing protein, partial [Candidatus Marinimicrobia bacterium]|nr:DHHA1 domain-containing protein [Candidatus Neomarinimicrobiota bacterium]
TLLGVSREQLPNRIEKLLIDYKNLEKQLHKNNKADLEQEIDTLLEKAEMIGELKVFTYQANVKSLAELKEIGDLVRDKLHNGIGVIAGVIDEKPSIAVVVTDLAIKQYGLKAGDIVRELGRILGGGGGGQAHLATAGGRFTDKIPEALQAVIPLIKSKIESKR